MPHVSLTQEEHLLLLSPSNEHNFLNLRIQKECMTTSVILKLYTLINDMPL